MSETPHNYFESESFENKEAQQYFEENTKFRNDFLKSYLPNFDSNQESKLNDYLLDSNDIVNELSETEKRILPGCMILSAPIGPKSGMAALELSEYAPKSQEMADMMLFSQSEFVIKDQIANFRGTALIYKYIEGEDPVQKVKDELISSFLLMYANAGSRIHPRLAMIASQDQMDYYFKQLNSSGQDDQKFRDAFTQFMKEYRQEEKDKLVESGTHERFIESNVNEQIKGFENVILQVSKEGRKELEEINLYLSETTDPRILIDKILETQDGKLPL